MAAAGLIHTTTYIRAFVAPLAGIMAPAASMALGSTVAGDTPTGDIAAATVAVCTGDGRSPCGAGTAGASPAAEDRQRLLSRRVLSPPSVMESRQGMVELAHVNRFSRRDGRPDRHPATTASQGLRRTPPACRCCVPPAPPVAGTAALDQHSGMRTVRFFSPSCSPVPLEGRKSGPVCDFGVQQDRRGDQRRSNVRRRRKGVPRLPGRREQRFARGGAIQERCERDFLKHLPRARLRAYNSALDACARKYGRRER